LLKSKFFKNLVAVKIPLFVLLAGPAVLVAYDELSPELNQVSPEKLFRRCYSNLTGKYATWNNEKMVRVRSGELSALEACEQIIENSTLDENGYVVDDADSISMLRNFSNLHSTWFVVDDPIAVSEQASVAADSHDNIEASLYFTRALFDPEKDFTYVFKADKVPMALRDEASFDLINRYRQTSTPVCDPETKTCVCEGNYAWCDINNSPESSKLVQRGRLLGVSERVSTEHTLVNQSARELTSSYCDPRDDLNGYRPSECFEGFSNAEHLGGGILGSTVYHHYNLPAQFGKTVPPVHISRRWAQNFYKTFTCRDLPMIKQAHPEVDLLTEQTSNGNPWVLSDTDIPYRRSVSCMECHATMDQMAYTSRRFVPVSSRTALNPPILTNKPLEDYSDRCIPGALGFKWLCDHEIFDHLEVEKSGVYPRRSVYSRPLGRLYYVDVNNSLINEPVVGHIEIGEKLLEKDDVYACVASRYFEHFTGVTVSLDPFAESGQLLSENDLAYKKIVLQLGRNFKESRNMKSLILDIMNLPMYNRELPRLAVDEVNLNED
jgi:hypothetical protein